MSRINYLPNAKAKWRPTEIWYLLGGLLAVLAFARLLFPSDIPFINDEALLVIRALEQNQAGTWTSHGLLGSRGVDYGPFALWFYRSALLFTNHLVLIAVFKIIFVSTLTCVALFWLARLCNFLNPLFAAAALLSPYLWFYARDLWDNSFVIPFSALAFASYLAFCESEKRWQLSLAALLLTLGFLTHLVFLPVAAAFFIHFVFYRFYWIRENRKFLVFLAFGLFVLAAPYLLHLVQQRPTQKLEFGNFGHAAMPFTGARFFTAFGLEYFMGKDWYEPFSGNTLLNLFWMALLGFSLLAYPLTWWGIFRSGQTVYENIRDDRGIHFDAAWIAVSAFLLQILLSWAYRLIPIPNFHSALWIFYFFFLWRSLTEVASEPLAKRFISPYLFSLFVSLIAMTVLVRLYGGNRQLHHGPTLGNLIEVTEKLSRYSDKSSLSVEAFHPKEFPWSLQALELLKKYDAPKSAKSISAHRLSLRYKNPSNPKDGRLELIEVSGERNE